jgi:hypothetical protein
MNLVLDCEASLEGLLGLLAGDMLDTPGDGRGRLGVRNKARIVICQHARVVVLKVHVAVPIILLGPSGVRFNEYGRNNDTDPSGREASVSGGGRGSVCWKMPSWPRVTTHRRQTQQNTLKLW